MWITKTMIRLRGYAQASLSLRCADVSEGTFSYVVALICYRPCQQLRKNAAGLLCSQNISKDI